MTQDEIIAKLIHDTSIGENITALEANKLKCMTDSRVSSKIVGLVGTAIISSVFGLIVFIDVSTVVAKVWQARKTIYTK